MPLGTPSSHGIRKSMVMMPVVDRSVKDLCLQEVQVSESTKSTATLVAENGKSL